MGEKDKTKLNLEELVPEVYLGSIEDFYSEAVSLMNDRYWCRIHNLNYSEVTFREVATELYYNYLNKKN